MKNIEKCDCDKRGVWPYGKHKAVDCPFRPQKENKKEPMPTIDKYIEEFKKVFPLLRVFPSPENGQEIERFCDEEIQSWLSHALQTYGEERYEEGKDDGRGEMIMNSKGFIERTVLPAEMIEKIKADGEAQGIRRCVEAVEKVEEYQTMDEDEPRMIGKQAIIIALQAFLPPLIG